MIAEKKKLEEEPRSSQPLPVAKESGFVETKVVHNRNRNKPSSTNPAPHVTEGSSSGAIAAGIVSVLIVILIGFGFMYMVTRTRLVPRLRARITNTPYEDIIINDRNPQNLNNPQQAQHQQQQQLRRHHATPLA